jgi:hypothetical protein
MQAEAETVGDGDGYGIEHAHWTLALAMTLGPLGEGDSCHIAKLDLANFSTASYGDSVGHSLFAKHKHMLRCLVSTKSLSGPGTQIVIGRSSLTGGDQDKGTHHFSVFLVGDADDRS